MSLPPKYVPDVVVPVMAYAKATAGSRQYHPRRFEVLAPADCGRNDLLSAWSVLYSDQWSLLGNLLRIETEVSYDSKAL